MKWKHLFQPHILSRGLDYYSNNQVAIEEVSEDQIVATVEGSEFYDVSIELTGEKISRMYCDCPYAEDGSNCKHMAAVLYAAEQEYEVLIKSPADKKSLSEAIAALPRDVLEQLLLEQGKKNAKLREKIILIATKKLPKNYRTIWQKEISAILLSDDYDYMDFDDAYDHFGDLTIYLEEKVEELIKSSFLWEAFELVELAYQTVMDLEEFDWDAIFDEMIDTCNAHWSDIYEKADIDTRRRMFRQLRSRSEDSQNFCDSFLADTLISIFIEPEFSLELLIDVDSALQTPSDETIDSLISQRICLMEHLGLSKQEQLDFLQPFTNHAYARQLQIDLLISEGREDDAVSLLKKSKQMDTDQSYLLDGYCRKLILLYQKSGKAQELQEELAHYVLNYTQKDVEYIQLLKEVSPAEEWRKLSEQLQLSKSMQNIWDQFLVFEELWETLMRKIEFSANTMMLSKHEECLRERFPDRVCDLWIRAAEDFMLRANDRGAYRYAASLLGNAMVYPGGKDKAFTVASMWKTTYPRRTALREELKKVGL